MEMSKVVTDASGIFRLSDCFATIESESESSISLILGCFTNCPTDIAPDSEWFFQSSEPTSFFQQFGWIDLHYPCKGHRKVFIRMSLPSEFHDPDRLEAIIQALFELFSIPPKTPCVAYYFTVDNLYCILPKDEFGEG